MKTKTHKRKIVLEVCLPAAVELIVESDDEDPDDESDWQIRSVTRVSCEPTPRTITEHMHDCDFEAMAVAAANAKDLP